MSCGLKVATSSLQHLRRDRHEAQARLGRAGAGHEVGHGPRVDEVDRGRHVGAAHPVFVEDVERVVAAEHVDPREGAPRAADEEEAVLLLAHLGLQASHDLRDVGLEPLLPAFDVGEPEGTERRGHAAPDEAAAEFGQFHRRSADVADHPVGPRPAEEDALRGEPRLLVAVDDPEAEAGLPL